MANESYTNIRLEIPPERTDSDDTDDPRSNVIVYFAPVFEVSPTHSNDVFTSSRGGGRAPVVRDNGLWESEVTVTGTFQHSDHVPPLFQSTLQEMFDQDMVTPTDQINRLVEQVVYSDPGHYHFYHNENEYTANTENEIDIGSNIYPAVSISSLEVPEDGETSGIAADFSITMAVGIERAEGPEVPDV